MQLHKILSEYCHQKLIQPQCCIVYLQIIFCITKVLYTTTTADTSYTSSPFYSNINQVAASTHTRVSGDPYYIYLSLSQETGKDSKLLLQLFADMGIWGYGLRTLPTLPPGSMQPCCFAILPDCICPYESQTLTYDGKGLKLAQSMAWGLCSLLKGAQSSTLPFCSVKCSSQINTQVIFSFQC